MTDYKQDIYARLAAGENVEDIAAELTKSINEANDQYKADQEAKATPDKVEAIDNLLASILMVLDVWDIDSTPIQEILEDDQEFNKLVKAFDEYVPIVKSYLALMKSVQEAADKEKKRGQETAAVAPKKKNTFDRVQSTNVEGQTEIMSVEDFLNKFVR